uniref:Uncharacterized protein n=1 Tax=Oryza sativa subsp. japonica TaxID=39947 RepID=Q6YU00_ORYSJ|nr:hypothetical protein [Oryza sativa Japonica Group]BAD17727.1 hypothetical protein [Oryza sativa Japonica Group]
MAAGACLAVPGPGYAGRALWPSIASLSGRPDHICSTLVVWTSLQLAVRQCVPAAIVQISYPAEAVQDPDSRIKRRRGPTKLANVENLPEGVKIIDKLDRFNVPCSQSAIVLGSYLGTLVRKPYLTPLNILQWNHKLYKRVYYSKMISEVERKFAIDGRANNWILHQLDGKLRQYKSKLKKGYYKPNLPMERALQTVPKTVAESQWATLVSYWYSEDSKNEVYMKLAEKRVDGQEVSVADFEQTMLEVFGQDRSGRVRGMGPTIIPTNYYGGRFSNILGSSEGSSSSNVNGFISFIVSYLTEKYPEDNLISRLPPSVARVIPRQENHGNQLPNTTPPSSARASSQSCSEEE